MKFFHKGIFWGIIPLVIGYLIYLLRVYLTLKERYTHDFIDVADGAFFIIATVLVILLLIILILFSKIDVTLTRLIIGICWIISICLIFITLFFKIIA